MKDPDLDRLFERFRRRGDVEAMGAIFDATVVELSRVGSAWARTADEVEDLVQATYLTAIERSERYEGGRKLVAWLLGILVMHAHELRARRGRHLDPGRLHERSAEPAEARALGGELAEAFGAALGRLRESERRVVEPFLVEGKSPKAIAEEQGERAGTVRMQLHRGLARLREILPAGFALGTAVVLIGDRARAQVRERVLHHASEIAAASAAAGGTVVGSTGGLSVQTLTLTSLALAVLTVGGWFAFSPDPAVQPAPAVSALASSILEPPTPVAETALADPATLAQDARLAVSDAAAANDAGARVSGRLLYPDGTAAAGLELVLFGLPTFAGRLSLEDYVAPDGALLEPSRVHATTDAAGRFTLDGWSPHERQLLAVDPGGPWGSLVQVHASPDAHGSEDLGTFHLLTLGLIRGQVVDTAGQPIAGARVRVGAYPDVSIPDALAGELTPDSRIFATQGSVALTLELPAWARPFVERAPLPTVYTDEQGRFELPRSATNEHGEIPLIVDAEGFVATSQTLHPMGLSERELDPIALGHGRRVEGVLRSPDGQPLAGWDVFVGAFTDEDPNGLAHPAGQTGTDGRFAMEHVSAYGTLAAVAVPPGSKLGVLGTVNDGGLFELVAQPMTSFVVTVRDEDGAPIENAELRLRIPAFNELDALLMHTSLTQPWSASAPGEFMAEGLTMTRMPAAVVVRAPGFASAQALLLPGTTAAEVVLSPPEIAELRLLDGRTGAPLAGASASITPTDSSLALARGVSDADGRCRLAGALAGAPQLTLRVDHPELAPWRGPWRRGDTERELTLDPGATVAASMRGFAGLPYTLTLRRSSVGRGAEERLLWSAVSDAGGNCALRLLPADEYAWVAHVGPLQGLPLGVETREPFATGRLRIVPGKTTELILEAPAPEAPVAASGMGLHGHVRLNGEPLEGALVRVIQEGTATAPARADASGNYEVRGLRAGSAKVSIGLLREAGGTTTFHSLGWHEAEVRVGELSLADWDLATFPVEVLVEDRSGPLAGAEVFLSGPEESRHRGLESGRTTDQGLARLDPAQPGTYRMRAVHPERGLGLGTVVVGEAGQVVSARVLLDRGVPCAGTVTVPRGQVPEARYTLIVDDTESRSLLHTPVRFADGKAAFELTGLPPGEYLFSLSTERSGTFEPTPVVVPSGGNAEMELELELPPASAGRAFQAAEIDR